MRNKRKTVKEKKTLLRCCINGFSAADNAACYHGSLLRRRPPCCFNWVHRPRLTPRTLSCVCGGDLIYLFSNGNSNIVLKRVSSKVKQNVSGIVSL